MLKEIIFVSFYDAEFGTFGYGRKFGKNYEGPYFAIYYGGNLLHGFFDNSFMYNTINGRQFKKYETAPIISASGDNNRYALLFGIGTMGLRLSYASTLGSFSAGNILTEDDGMAYKSYETALGWMVPQLQWGLNSPITKIGIRPTVTFDFGIKRDFYRSELYIDPATDFNTNNEEIHYSRNYLQPSLSLGLGGLNVFTKPGFTVDLDLDYSLVLRFYNNDYSYPDADGKNHILSISGLNDAGVLMENSFIQNSVSPSVVVEFIGLHRLKFKGTLSLPVTLLSYGETEMQIVPGSFNGELQRDGNDTSLLLIQFSPLLQIGVQFEIIPNRLNLNIGGTLQFASVTWGLLTIENYLNADKSGTLTGKSVSYGEFNASNYSDLSPTIGTNQISCLSVGFTFAFNKKFALDFMTGLNLDNQGNEVNIFGITGRSLTSFSGILLSLKI